MKGRQYAIWFLILFPLSTCFGSSAQRISGTFFENEPRNPLPGALIALYSESDNLLVDYTYSVDNGQFALNPPATKGSYYIVATKDKYSQRTNFEYDPQSPPVNIEIKYQKSKGKVRDAIVYGWSKLDYLITSVLGFVLGLGYKLYESRRQAQRTMTAEAVYVGDSIAKLLVNREKLSGCRTAFKRAEPRAAPQIGAEYDKIAAAIDRQVDELQSHLSASKDLKSVIYSLHGSSGVERYVRFQDDLTQIRDFANLKLGSTVLDEKEKEHQNLFRALSGKSLFK